MRKLKNITILAACLAGLSGCMTHAQWETRNGPPEAVTRAMDTHYVQTLDGTTVLVPRSGLEGRVGVIRGR